MAQVKAIPDGYHSLTPFLNVKGAAAAIEFYQRAFGAKLVGRMDTPDGQVMHAEVEIGDSRLMLSDAMQRPPTQSSILIYTKDADALFAQAVAAGAQVVMPLSNQFWGDRYGLVADPFGNTWSIATHIEDVSMEEMGRRAQTAMSQQS